MTVRRRKASLLAYSKFIELPERLLPFYKLPTVQQRAPHPLPELEDDLERLVNVCRSEEERALVACLGYEGMRMHESLSLPVNNILLDVGAIDVIGKGDKERRIPITENAAQYLYPQIIASRIMGRSLLVGLQDRNARNIITMLGERAGLRRAISSHDLRATFATVVYRETKDIRLVQALLGHADISTTQIYIGLTFDQMREAVKRF